MSLESSDLGPAGPHEVSIRIERLTKQVASAGRSALQTTRSQGTNVAVLSESDKHFITTSIHQEEIDR